MVAGGGAYYFAKRSINAERARHAAEEQRRRRAQEELEWSAPPPTSSSRPKHSRETATEHIRRGDYAGSPSQEASEDPAPTRHAPENERQKAREKSKYESSEVYRSKKGDRFS